MRLPQLGATQLHMYYGNQTAANVSDPAQVWSNDYLAVLHMNDVASTVRSAAWLEAEHASLTDALVSYGDEELHP